MKTKVLKIASKQRASHRRTPNIECEAERQSIRADTRGASDFFKNVLNSIPYAQYLIDAGNMTVIWKNSATGSGDLPQDAKCYSYLHGRDKPCSQIGRLCLLEQARALKRFVLFEETYNDEVGGDKHVELQGFPVFDSHGRLTHLIESRIDISPRKRAQHALYESEQKYKTLFQDANDAIFLIDGDSRYVLNANRAAERLLGVPMEEILVMHETELLTPQIIDRIEMEVAAQGEPANSVDADIVRKDGFVVPVCISSSEVTLHGRKLVQRVFKDMTEYRQAEARLLDYQKALRTLASQLSLAQERERRRIAARVHDSIGQTLSVCSMKLGALSESLATTRSGQAAREIDALVKETIQQTRMLAREISPPLLYEIGLEAAIDSLIEQMKDRCGIQFSFVHDTQPLVLDNDTLVTVFEAIRELLINAMKHSQAEHVEIEMRRKGDSLRTVVVDDGAGFDSSENVLGTRTKGFGLFSIRERLQAVGGHVVIKSQYGTGTRIVFSVPLEKNESADYGDRNGDKDSTGGRP